MRPRTYKTVAIIIKRINVGETDKILTLFTPKYGKLRCLAKGIRRLTSRRASALELFSQTNLMLANGKNLDLIAEVNLEDGFRNLCNDLGRIRYAYQFCELVNLMTGENQEQSGVFDLLQKALQWLDRTPKIQIEGLRRFQLRLLEELGFGLPKKQNLENLNFHIENIINRKLVAGEVWQ